MQEEYQRFQRQIYMQGWQQDKLSQCKIMILGAGSLGNEVAKNLALIGVSNILIVDFDKIEISNLSRTVLFSSENVGKYKAETLAAGCRQLSPAINASYINGDVMFDVGLGFYRESDIVIGCVDNIGTRARASLNAALAGVPYLDTGVWGYGGEIKWFLPEGPSCFNCSLSLKDEMNMTVRHSCTGFKLEKNNSFNTMIPSTLAPSAIIGGMAAQEVCHYLNGTRAIKAGEVIVYSGVQPSLHISFVPNNPACEHNNSKPYKNVFKLSDGAKSITANALLQIAAKTLGEDVEMALSYDFLYSLYCPFCNEYEMIKMRIADVPENKAFCPVCKKRRKKNLYASLTMQDEACHNTLYKLGVPKGEILMLHSTLGMEFYQLHGDIEEKYVYTK